MRFFLEALQTAIRPQLHGLKELATVGYGDFGGRSVNDVNAASIGAQRSISFLRLRDTLVVDLLERAGRHSLGQVMPAPEVGDVQFALRVALQDQESVDLRRLNDRIDVD